MFLQTIAERQQLECTELSTALKYLQASLHGVILDTLRAHARPRRIAELKSRNAGVLRRKDDINARQWWERMQHSYHVYNGLACSLLSAREYQASDRFMRDTILISNFSQRLLVLKHTMEHNWPF